VFCCKRQLLCRSGGMTPSYPASAPRQKPCNIALSPVHIVKALMALL
jgi:hypothetical protein